MIPTGKRFKYKKANIRFSWNKAVEDSAEETTVNVEWEFITNNDKKENHSYNRTVAQIESFYIPLIRVIKGYDSLTHALLYVNDEYARGIYLRLIEQGTDFITLSGIKVDEDGKWKLE